MPLRLGVDGALPAAPGEVTVAQAKRLRKEGFVCVGVHFTAQDPFAITDAECHRVRDVLADEGISVAQSTGYAHYTLPLIHPDASVRQRALQVMREGLRIGVALGAASVLTGAGSLSAHGAYAPHPGNFSPQSFDLLVDTLRKAAGMAGDFGLPFAVEGHLLTTISSPERMVQLLDAVGSPHVQAICDPVNYIGTVSDYYANAEVQRRFVAPLAGRIACAHAKDTVLGNQLTLHLSEGAPGEGNLDLVTFLGLLAEHVPECPIILEHMPLERMLLGAVHLRRVAAEAGVALLTQA